MLLVIFVYESIKEWVLESWNPGSAIYQLHGLGSLLTLSDLLKQNLQGSGSENWISNKCPK